MNYCSNHPRQPAQTPNTRSTGPAGTGLLLGDRRWRRAGYLIIGRRLKVSVGPKDMDLPGLVLHPLTGSRKGTWAVRVSSNWRVTFSFVERDAAEVDYEDYH